MRATLLFVLTLALCPGGAAADWPTLRGGPERTGFVEGGLRGPFRIAWVRHFAGERMSSALEPIVAGGRVFAATHSGSLHALDARTGEPLWRFHAGGPFLHSPAAARSIVVAGSTDGFLHGVEAATGKGLWKVYLEGAHGGYAASPLIFDHLVFLGSRSGVFAAFRLRSGDLVWKKSLGAPVRQSAAGAGGRVYVTAEDLRVRCFDAKSGEVLWTSRQLEGQSARDYYPVIQRAGGRELVLVRTSPTAPMPRRIQRDRRVLVESAGVDDSDWKKVDAWTKSDAARGNPEAWAREHASILRHLEREPDARTLHVLDARTGEAAFTAPVLWCGGCQGVGSPPVALPDGRLQVFLRSAYGHWSHGVAPLVALGILDPKTERVDLLEHRRGPQPPWNTFWGTADESQNFAVAGRTLLIVHQSTLSGFDLDSGDLFPIAGERDGWGGFRNLPWARNEWNGPARGCAAIAGSRLYWQTGSRLICVASGETGPAVADVEIDGSRVPAPEAPAGGEGEAGDLGARLADEVRAILARRWAPFVLEPGIAGREVAFARSADVFEALSLAFPRLPEDLRASTRAFLAAEWSAYPPCTPAGAYRLDEGARREYHPVPGVSLEGGSRDPGRLTFADCAAVALYAERVGEWERVRADWARVAAAFDDFSAAKWRLDPARGDLHANAYLSSLLAFERLARRAEDGARADEARKLAGELGTSLCAWWRRAAERAATPVIRDISEWDRFIGGGDALFFRIQPHRAKIALFHELSPGVAAIVREREPAAVEKVWSVFETLCTTRHLAGEERQVHYGENFTDPPDFTLDAFRAAAWLRRIPSPGLRSKVDLPVCRADLGWVERVAIGMDAP